jgi:radical SAM superfamily enzyme YgiQ (UPF0313 family)
LGISVSIWNHLATIELLEELNRTWQTQPEAKPVVVLGGPEVSHLPPDAPIFRYADYVIRGEGENAFRILCEKILTEAPQPLQETPQFITAENVNLSEIKSAYHLYTDEDVSKKLIYVESSRGCPFHCEFCLSSIKNPRAPVSPCEFPLEPFLTEMAALIQRGVKTFKFLDRTFNINIPRALKIMDFFLEKLEQGNKFVVHFEMVPSLFPEERAASSLRETLTRFPPGSLRLEIGIQTLNPEVSALISRPCDPEKDLETLRWLRANTNAIIHADLIAGLPGEDLASFGSGFDRLVHECSEIQLGILKLLPGAPIARHNEAFAMRYNPLPPYEIEETSAISAKDLSRIKNFARFWEILVNRGLILPKEDKPVFDKFLALSDALFERFGRNWGIDRAELQKAVENIDI